jgi:hypothetical protein
MKKNFFFQNELETSSRISKINYEKKLRPHLEEMDGTLVCHGTSVGTTALHKTLAQLGSFGKRKPT